MSGADLAALCIFFVALTLAFTCFIAAKARPLIVLMLSGKITDLSYGWPRPGEGCPVEPYLYVIGPGYNYAVCGALKRPSMHEDKSVPEEVCAYFKGMSVPFVLRIIWCASLYIRSTEWRRYRLNREHEQNSYFWKLTPIRKEVKA